MMRSSVLATLLVCLALSSTLQAQTAEDETTSDRPREPAGESADASGKPLSRLRPETTFTPSEKIRADSAVSFPVDI